MKKIYASLFIFSFFLLECYSIGTAQTPVEPAVNNNAGKHMSPQIQANAGHWMNHSKGIRFLENKGQMTDMQGNAVNGLLFKASAGSADMYITTWGISYVFFQVETHNSLRASLQNKNEKHPLHDDSLSGQYCRADMNLVGANIQPENIVREDESEDITDYYIGGLCPDGIKNVHTYGKITIKNIYPGIDWVLFSGKHGVEYDFIIHPGADPSQIKMKYKWADKPALQADGSLSISTPLGNIKEGVPVSYEGKAKNKIVTNYVIQDSTIQFELGKYNKNETLVIDPPLVWATYIKDNGGGSALVDVYDIYDDGTYVWITGQNNSYNTFPTIDPGGGAYFQGIIGDRGGINAFIMKFTLSGVLIWSTYYGGSNGFDRGYSISSDGTNVWVTGEAESTDFPVANPEGATYYQASSGGYDDVFILQFTIAGVRQWATYYGGSRDDIGNSICSDGKHVWVTGYAVSSNFPIFNQPGAYNQSTFAVGRNIFILEFTVTGVQVWGTYFGTGTDDQGYSISSDGNNVWLTGQSITPIPIKNVVGAYNQSTGNGGFIAKFDTSGVLRWASMFTGTTGTVGYSVNSDGTNVWLTGRVNANGLPTYNPGGGAYFQGTSGGYNDAFIANFDTSGAMKWSTYYGGNNSDIGYSIQSDKANVWLCGSTSSPDFPTLNPGSGFYQGTQLGGTEEIFIAQFSTSGVQKWSTYYGEDHEDDGSYITTDGKNVFMSADAEPAYYPVKYPTVDPGGGAYFYDSAGALENVIIAKFTWPSPTDSIVDSTNVSCAGSSTGSATVGVRDGTAPYTYLWSPNGGTLATATGLSAGTYTVTVTDNNNLSATTTVVITQPPVLSVSAIAVTNELCNGGNDGSASSTVTGGVMPYTYAWSNGSTISTASNLSAGTYTLNVTDSYGCTGSAIVLITQPNSVNITANINATISCNGGNNGSASVTINAGTAPYTYSWSDANSQTTASASGLTAGSYTITVMDSCGNSATSSIVISQPNILSVSANPLTNVGCKGGNNGSAVSTIIGGTMPYTYSWSDGSTISTASNLSAGTYSLNVTDSAGCTGTASVLITQPTMLDITALPISNVLCNGGNDGSASSSVSGGASPYTYLWTNGETTDTAINLSAGSYTLTITDNNGCTGTVSVYITQPTPIKDSIAKASVCAGDTASLSDFSSGGIPPYTYLWSNGATTSTIRVAPLVSRKYLLTVTDSNGCVATDTGFVIVNQPPVLTLIFQSKDTVCNTAGVIKIFVGPGGGTLTGYAVYGSNFYPDSAITGAFNVIYYSYTDSNGCSSTIADSIYVDLCTGTNALAGNNGGVNVFPNPNNGVFTIQSSEFSGQCSVEIYNVLGEKVYSDIVHSSRPNGSSGRVSFIVDISSKPNGIYFYRVLKNDGNLLGEGKIVIEK